ncbi:MAG: preprotein translocase subunit YajC [Deltaproteobacteria bacterium]
MQQGANFPVFVIQLILIIGIFYFLLIRPQKAEQKKRQDMLGKLAKNDEIVTSSGIHGTVINVKDKTVTLRIDENVKIELEKAAVAEVIKRQG